MYQRHDLSEFHLFTPAGVQEGDQRSFRRELDDPQTWYLVDSVRPLMCSAATVLVSSPHPNTYKEFLKIKARMRYMPVWQREELQLVREVCCLCVIFTSYNLILFMPSLYMGMP